MSQLLIWFATGVVFAHHPASAEARKLIFQSSADRFELTLDAEGGGTIDGKPAEMREQRDLVNALIGEVTGACPDLSGAPDLTIREGEKNHEVFFKAGVVREGKNCLSIGGDELFRAPIHRDFLIGAKEDKLNVGADLSLHEDDRTLIAVKRQGTEWTRADGDTMPNEDFFRRLADRLRSFSIRQRLSPIGAEGKRHVVIKTGGRSYDFYKVTEGAWALKKPGAKWLEVSDDWSFWYDLDPHTLEDSYSEQIRAVADTTRPVDERVAQMKRLQVTWSGNVRALCRRLLLEPNVDSALSDLALRRLKTKPSRETAAVMVEVLESSQPDPLKLAAANLLRLQNPKGPKFDPAAAPTAQRTVIEYWRTWLKKGSA